MTESIQSTDIAIIGGGIAGVYTAWRLLGEFTEGSKRKVRLYEATDRLGGRLASVEIPGLAMRAELGAMRYSDKQHQLVNRLINHLGLEHREFEVPISYYLRGRILVTDSLKHGHCAHCLSSYPFRLLGSESKLEPGELVVKAIEQILKNLNFPPAAYAPTQTLQRRLHGNDWERLAEITSTEWEWIKQHAIFENVDLYDIGFWNLLQHHLSNEAITFLQDGLGYASIVGNWNAAEAMSWYVADFDPDQKWHMLCAGFETLVKKLESDLAQVHDGPVVERNRCLKMIAPAEGSRWKLQFTDGSIVLADSVVLSLPRHALESLVIKHAKWREVKEDAVLSVRPHRLFKVFLVYDHAWWQDRRLPAGHDGGHAETGRVNSDSPLRQVYYFGPTWITAQAGTGCLDRARDALVSGKPSPFAMVMASYSDSHHVGFWDPVAGEHRREDEGSPWEPYLQLPQRDETRLTNEARERLNDIARKHGASKRLVDKVQHLLEELHGMREGVAPKPIVGLYMNWGKAPYHGGWHTWEPGRQPWNCAQAIIKPFEDARIYVCGEAYSREQGWVEGALTTAEQVLAELGVHPFDISTHEWTGRGLA